MADEINTNAEINVESDIGCTFSSAVKVTVSVGRPEVIFVPDKYLAHYNLAHYISTKAEKKIIP